MTFEEYLTKRRVNVAAFAAGEPQRFAEWQHWFSQMHPESFYTMVKMVLNDVRRNYWLAEVPKPVLAAENTETAAVVSNRPAGRRAAIARPATSTSEIAKTENPAEVAPTESEKPAETTTSTEGTIAAKPARPVFKPRGVIKKATAEEIQPSSEVPETEKPAESNLTVEPSTEIKPEAAKETTETPETSSTKPIRPRAVIKRPSALSKSTSLPEESGEKTPENSAEKVEEVKSEMPETLSIPAEKPDTDNVTETPKPPRPRPVFKRPASTTPTSETTSAESEKTVGETPQKPETSGGENSLTESPVAIPGQEGASAAKTVSEEIQQNPDAAKAAEEVAAEAGHVPKPPRPRPVFKRPAAPEPPETAASEAENTLAVSAEKVEDPETKQNPELNPEEIQPEKSAETPGIEAEKVEDATPKPPRPRPIFKRPNKPKSDELGSS